MKKNLAILLLVAGGVAVSPLSFAQETGSGTPRTIHLSLGEAIELAEGLSPRLGEFRAMIQLAEAGVENAKIQEHPTLGVEAGYRRYNNVPEWTVQQGEGEVLIFPNLPNFWNLKLSGLIPLYSGGRVPAEITAAEHTVLASNHELESQTDNLELQVTSIYWQLVLAIEQERILAESIQSFEAHLVDALNRQEVGLVASNEPLAVQTERDRAELRRLLAASAVRNTQDQLAVLIGLPIGTRVLPTDELSPGAAPPQSVEDLVALAKQQRPERKALEQRIASGEAKLEAANSVRGPNIGITGSVSYLNPDRRVVPPRDEFRFAWDIGIGLQYFIFDGGTRKAAAGAALAELDATRQRLQELDRAIRNQVVESHESLQTALAAITVAEQAVRSARENLRVTRDLYLEGLIPSSERLDAQVAELLAGLELTESRIQVQLARASLRRALGGSGTPASGVQTLIGEDSLSRK